MIKLTRIILFVTLALVAVGCSAETEPTQIEPTTTEPAEGEITGWNLVWQDEFNGEELNPENWTFDLGATGWGNNEWQNYTDRPENVRLEEGILIIEAREEEFRGSDYTSARIKTQGLHTWQYGRIEARIDLPEGQGIWPAMWMLGEDFPSTPWPQSGEIDIMEFIGDETDTVYGTVHGPGYSGSNGVGSEYEHPEGANFADDFHIFALEWMPGRLEWSVDGEVFHTLQPPDVPGEWVYEQPFFLIMNIAVGGEWPGYPDETTVFPQQMRVDYLRIYDKDVYPTPDPAIMMTPTPDPTLQLHLADLQVEVVESDDGGWQASVVATVRDENGDPVEGATVSGNWIGLVSDGDVSATTSADGQTPAFLSHTTSEAGTITFCVTKVDKQGAFYDIMRSVDTCTAATNE